MSFAPSCAPTQDTACAKLVSTGHNFHKTRLQLAVTDCRPSVWLQCFSAQLSMASCNYPGRLLSAHECSTIQIACRLGKSTRAQEHKCQHQGSRLYLFLSRILACFSIASNGSSPSSSSLSSSSLPADKAHHLLKNPKKIVRCSDMMDAVVLIHDIDLVTQ